MSKAEQKEKEPSGKSALLIIDAQNYFINERTKDIPEKIADFINKNKFDFVLFFKFVNSPDSNFIKLLNWEEMFGPPDTDIVPELERFATENNVFEKTAFSAFKSEEFVKFLKDNQTTKLFICGFDTDGCVLSTALEAFDLGFDVKILVDLCGSHHGIEYHANAIEILKRNAKSLPITSSEYGN